MTTPADPAFAAMVRGRSDQEIVALSQMFGGPRVLTGMFLNGLAGQFAGRTVEPPAVLGYEVAAGEATYEHTLRVGAGARIDEDGLEAADATFQVSFPDLVRLVSGVLEMGEAIGDGRVRVTGDPSVAQNVLAVLVNA